MTRRLSPTLAHDDDPLWYKDAIIYELHTRAFCDSNGDGVGDFRGLTEKLDYLQDLGVTALWLLPFYPSPLKDDGYDIADYTAIHPAYGTLRDFQLFLNEAHRRGLRVITELVLNHTSDQHPWFQRARRAAPGSRWRDYYVWSDTAERFREARIIFKDFEPSNWAWDHEAKAYFWHRFYAHQPDLNYDSPDVRRSMLRVVDFWLGMGVDGLRLDAVPYLYQREGTSCENLPETHTYLKALRHHIDATYKNRLLLAEANQWPEEAQAYFGDGDECQMAFHFPLMPRLFMAIHMEDRFPIVDILQQTPSIPESAQWALFLRNHDELTLEMVTDEERDYMYRAYARDPQARINLGVRRRLAPLLGNSRRRIELMNGLLFSLPGTVVVYYGDEIGMGDNVYLGDRNGVRTPMQWSHDRNAGFSQANAQQLYLPVIVDPEYHYEAVNVEAQQANPYSLFSWTKRLVALRKRSRAFTRGTLELLRPENRKVLTFIRRYEDERILVVANLSRFVQGVELDLAPYRGMVPVEMFGRIRFPAIGERPYFLTLGPHSFYWFALERARVERAVMAPGRTPALPTVTLADSWLEILQGRGRAQLEAALPDHLQNQRWFGGKGRTIQSASLQEMVPLGKGAEDPRACLCFVRVEYTEGEPETYLVPLSYSSGAAADQLLHEIPQAVLARLELKHGERGALFDALRDPAFCASLLEAIARRRRYPGVSGRLVAWQSSTFRRLRGVSDGSLEPTPVEAEQSNSSVVYGERFILKLFRRLGAGVNPELEVGRFLTDKTSFTGFPPVAGAIEYQREHDAPLTLAILHGFVPNEGDAWQYTLDALSGYYGRCQPGAAPWTGDAGAPPARSPLDLSSTPPPSLAREIIGSYLPAVELLGRRTAELHLALASHPEDPEFAPEPFTPMYQGSLCQSMLTATTRAFQSLRRGLAGVPDAAHDDARSLLERDQELRQRFRRLRDQPCSALRFRYHGDFHLGQVLSTGRDFVIIDFEGEPARPLSQRRVKRSPLRDVAGMLRSLHYAAYAASLGLVAGVDPGDFPPLEPWARFWHLWVSRAYLTGYLAVADGSPLLPAAHEERRVLLDAFLLDKALYELLYELNNRPTWVGIPLRGILQLLDEDPEQ